MYKNWRTGVQQRKISQMWRVSGRVKEQGEGVSSTLSRGGRAHSVCKIQIFSVQVLR